MIAITPTNIFKRVPHKLKSKEETLESIKTVIEKVIDPMLEHLKSELKVPNKGPFEPINVVIPNFNSNQKVGQFGLVVRRDETEGDGNLILEILAIKADGRSVLKKPIPFNQAGTKEKIIRELMNSEQMSKKILQHVFDSDINFRMNPN